MDADGTVAEVDALYHEGRLREALALATAERTKGVRSAELELLAAYVLLRLARFDEALVAVRDALAIDPESSPACLCYAETLQRLGLLKQALVAAQSKFVDPEGANLIRAKVAFDRGMFAAAIPLAESALQGYPDEVDLVSLLLASKWLANIDSGARSRLESMFFDEGNLEVGYRLAGCLERVKEPEAALRVLRKCVKEGADELYSLDLLSFLNRHKQFDEARELLDSLPTWQRELPDCRQQEAFTLLGEGRNEDALASAMSLFEDYPVDERYARSVSWILMNLRKYPKMVRVCARHIGQLASVGL